MHICFLSNLLCRFEVKICVCFCISSWCVAALLHKQSCLPVILQRRSCLTVSHRVWTVLVLCNSCNNVNDCDLNVTILWFTVKTPRALILSVNVDECVPGQPCYCYLNCTVGCVCQLHRCLWVAVMFYFRRQLCLLSQLLTLLCMIRLLIL